MTEPKEIADQAVAPPDPPGRRPLHTRILIGLLVGASLGLAANWLARVPVGAADASAVDADASGVDDRLEWVASHVADPVGKVFLRLIFMVVVPLVVSALTLGVVGMGDVRRLGRVGVRTLALTTVFSTAAVVIGVSLVNLLQPGAGLPEQQREQLRGQYQSSSAEAVEKARQAKSVTQILLDIIPENPIQEIVGALDGSSKGNGMLAVMFFALCMGVAVSIAGEKCNTLVAWLEGLFEMSMVIIGFAMRLAPYAVACLVFSVTSRLGLDILQTLVWFVLTVVVGLAIQMFVVYPLALLFFGVRSPAQFFSQASDAIVTAFGTSSSNATLPTALRVAERDLGIPPKIANFVLTIGATGNQNGTALFEGVVVLFLAQVFGVELSLLQQVTVVLMSVLAGIGTAGVPGGSLPLIVVVMQSVGVPGEGVGIILGVDRILDMCRTVLNVAGDLAIAKCVALWEGPENPAA
jgi:DAACS family dicarboxylate/amino acid:cation (Na+ or H+) symporter